MYYITSYIRHCVKYTLCQRGQQPYVQAFSFGYFMVETKLYHEVRSLMTSNFWFRDSQMNKRNVMIPDLIIYVHFL
jgi:hypothetical protein